MRAKSPDTQEAAAIRFEERALRHLDSLYNRAVDIAGSRQAAAALVKETFVRAQRAFANDGPDHPGRAWLFSIMFSLRRRGGDGDAPGATADPAVLPPEAWGASGALDGFDFARLAAGDPQWRAGVVAAVVDRLPGGLRDAVVLVDIDQFTHEEAARVLRCSAAALRERLFRARHLLLGKLSADARGSGGVGRMT